MSALATAVCPLSSGIRIDQPFHRHCSLTDLSITTVIYLSITTAQAKKVLNRKKLDLRERNKVKRAREVAIAYLIQLQQLQRFTGPCP